MSASKVRFIMLALALICTSASADDDKTRSKRQSPRTPNCGQPLYTGVVSEQSPPGTFILTAAATSPVGNSVTWSLQDTTLGKFTIDPTSGAVSVAGSLSRTIQRSALEFRIRATDNRNRLYCESTVRINILPNTATPAPVPNQQPYFTQNPYTFSLSNIPSGSVVGQVSVVNPSGGYVSYSISGSNQFAVNPQTGQITANQAVSAGTYTFTVNAATQFGTATTQVTVNVATGTGGRGVTFGQNAYQFTTASCGAGAIIGQVFAGGSSVSYAISGTSQFVINAQNGYITANGNINSGTYTFNVIAQSALGGTSIAQVTVQASCTNTATPPSFSQTQYTVTTTSCTTGTNVARVQAGGSIPPAYSLSGSSFFSIDPSSGQLSLNQNTPAGSYTIQIFATSSAGQATATVTVIVVCQNSPPAGQTTYVTTGSCPAGTQVGSICSSGFFGK